MPPPAWLDPYRAVDFHQPIDAICRFRAGWHWNWHEPTTRAWLLFDCATIADYIVPRYSPNLLGPDTFTTRALDRSLEPRVQPQWDAFTRLLARGAGYANLRSLERDLAQRCRDYRLSLHRIYDKLLSEEATPAAPTEHDDNDQNLFQDIETSLSAVALRFAVLHILLDIFAFHGVTRPWNKWPELIGPVADTADVFHLQLRLIHHVVHDPALLVGLRYNSELYRLAAEHGNLRYENDPANTIARNLKNNFPRYFHQPPPPDPQAWKTFFDHHNLSFTAPRST